MRLLRYHVRFFFVNSASHARCMFESCGTVARTEVDWATHGLPSQGQRCAVGALAGTYWCDDPSKQDDEPSERQPFVWW